MTFEIALVLGILVISLILFISEVIPMDVVALLVLGSLAVTGLVDSNQAFAGFSNSAVITVWAMFILSEGLTRTGIADIIGRQVMRAGGTREITLIFVIMITGAVLSAFMNNIGVAALMLPVVVDVARRTGIAASRLLMPLAYSTLLGGLMTLIGTPPNLLISESMVLGGYEPFALFDFTPLGGVVMVVGVLFVVIGGLVVVSCYPRPVPSAAASMSASAACAPYTSYKNAHSWCTYLETLCLLARHWPKLASVHRQD